MDDDDKRSWRFALILALGLCVCRLRKRSAPTLAALGTPLQARRSAPLLFTRAGGAVLFDLSVFIALVLVGAGLAEPALETAEGLRYMSFGAVGIALLWCSVTSSDWARFLKLRRRWLAQRPRRRVAEAVLAAVRRPSRSMPQPLPQVLSVCRPTRPVAPLPSLSLWRAGGRALIDPRLSSIGTAR